MWLKNLVLVSAANTINCILIQNSIFNKGCPAVFAETLKTKTKLNGATASFDEAASGINMEEDSATVFACQYLCRMSIGNLFGLN